MHVITGTPDTRTEHNTNLAMLGAMVSMAIPAAIAVAGVSMRGWDAIGWTGAIVWGIVATAAFTLFSMMGKAMGMTRMDLADLMGSMFVQPHTGASRMIGLTVHHVNGALLGIGYAYFLALTALPAGWLTGLLWGVILTPLAMLLMSSIGAVHPAIRAGQQDDPGTAGTNFGKMTPMGMLLGHLVYGVVLGALYAAVPLS